MTPLDPGWQTDLLAAVQLQMPRFSRSRLVDLLQGLVPLGTQLRVGSSPKADPLGPLSTHVPAAAPWVSAYLTCFLSRKFRQPLLRHYADLAVALAALCAPVAVAAWDEDASRLMRTIFPLEQASEGPVWLTKLPDDRVASVREALRKLNG